MADEYTVWIGLGGAVFGGFVTWLALGRRIDADERLALKKFEFDKELAQRKFDLDRAQIVHKRRFEFAEALLADANNFRDLMRYVRNGASFGNEGATRQPESNEPDDVKRAKDTYFVPIERLRKQADFISGFLVKRHAGVAHFGHDVAKAFDLFDDAINSVQVAAGMLIDMVGERDNDPQLLKQLRQDVWFGHSAARKEADQVNKKIEEGVLLIENLCRPVLEWNGE